MPFIAFGRTWFAPRGASKADKLKAQRAADAAEAEALLKGLENGTVGVDRKVNQEAEDAKNLQQARDSLAMCLSYLFEKHSQLPKQLEGLSRQQSRLAQKLSEELDKLDIEAEDYFDKQDKLTDEFGKAEGAIKQSRQDAIDTVEKAFKGTSLGIPRIQKILSQYPQLANERLVSADVLARNDIPVTTDMKNGISALSCAFLIESMELIRTIAAIESIEKKLAPVDAFSVTRMALKSARMAASPDVDKSQKGFLAELDELGFDLDEAQDANGNEIFTVAERLFPTTQISSLHDVTEGAPLTFSTLKMAESVIEFLIYLRVLIEQGQLFNPWVQKALDVSTPVMENIAQRLEKLGANIETMEDGDYQLIFGQTSKTEIARRLGEASRGLLNAPTAVLEATSVAETAIGNSDRMKRILAHTQRISAFSLNAEF